MENVSINGLNNHINARYVVGVSLILNATISKEITGKELKNQMNLSKLKRILSFGPSQGTMSTPRRSGASGSVITALLYGKCGMSSFSNVIQLNREILKKKDEE